MKGINVLIVMAPQQSYGLIAFDYIKGLLDAGIKVRVVPYIKDVPPGAVVPPYISENIGQLEGSWPRLIFHCTDDTLLLNVHKGDILYTMWETDKIPSTWAAAINRTKALLVPGTSKCEWGKQMYRSNGVKVPIFSVPLGVNSDIFKVEQNSFPRGAIFATAGRHASGRFRKGTDRVILAFLHAFPQENDVVLRVKSHPGCPVDFVTSPKIQIITTFLTEPDLARFYQESLCYVSGATGEGWGLHQHEAMMCGKPVISSTWGGIGAFFGGDKEGIRVPHKLEKVTNFFEGGNYGYWGVASIEDLAKAMRYAYTHRLDMFLRGLQAHQNVKHLDKVNMGKCLVKTLAKIV